MKYIKLDASKKYQLAEAMAVKVCGLQELYIDSHPFIKLNSGYLTVLAGYKWDGATGIPDNPDNMEASGFHDALYELMRLGLLDRKYRDVADQLFRRIAIKKGMKKKWANRIYEGLVALGASHTFPDKHPTGQIIEIP